MLADALAPHGGVVMWRAFVYSNDVPIDRIKQAYDEFKPLDGTFRENVLVQVKNGPLDFQPREPFHPLFGAMPKTPLMLEFQITKEYLGQDTHLAYLGPTVRGGAATPTPTRRARARRSRGSIDGLAARLRAHGHRRRRQHRQRPQLDRLAVQPGQLVRVRAAGVGSRRLAPRAIADEWIRMTFTNDRRRRDDPVDMMLASREAVVNYMTPLGLAHIMATGHHYGPGPWVRPVARDWTPVVLPPRRHARHRLRPHRRRAATPWRSTSRRSATASRNRATVPDSVLLWFHRVRWDDRMRGGRTLWDELVHPLQRGRRLPCARCSESWAAVRPAVDADAVRRSGAVPGHPGARGALVAGRGVVVFPDVLADADSGDVRAAGASARVSISGSLVPRIARQAPLSGRF